MWCPAKIIFSEVALDFFLTHSEGNTVFSGAVCDQAVHKHSSLFSANNIRCWAFLIYFIIQNFIDRKAIPNTHMTEKTGTFLSLILESQGFFNDCRDIMKSVWKLVCNLIFQVLFWHRLILLREPPPARDLGKPFRAPKFIFKHILCAVGITSHLENPKCSGKTQSAQLPFIWKEAHTSSQAEMIKLEWVCSSNWLAFICIGRYIKHCHPQAY